MSYEDQAGLAEDVPFSRRVSACISEEAKGHTGDNLATLVLRDPVSGTSYFMPFLSTAPGFGDQYAEGGSEAIDDGAILSAVQANWDTVSALYPEDELVPE